MTLSSTTKWITIGVMAGCCIILIVWDIVANANAVEGDTISELVLAFARRWPIATAAVLFPIGFILGHLLWPQYIKELP